MPKQASYGSPHTGSGIAQRHVTCEIDGIVVTLGFGLLLDRAPVAQALMLQEQPVPGRLRVSSDVASKTAGLVGVPVTA